MGSPSGPALGLSKEGEMRRILIFISLKIAECLGLVIVFFILCLLGHYPTYWIMGEKAMHWADLWIGRPMFAILVLSVSCFVFFGSYLIFKRNWQLARKLEKRWRK